MKLTSVHKGAVGLGALVAVLALAANGFSNPQVNTHHTYRARTTAADYIVEGDVAPGAAPASNPVAIAGFDGTNVQRIATDTNGYVKTLSQAGGGNSAVNVAQVGGNTTAVGNGTTSTGTQRVTLSSDSTGQVALATGANVIGTLTANQSVNTAQINGVTPLMGNGVTGTGSQRVTIASDNTAFNVNAGLNPSATSLNTYSVHLTSNATTTPTSSTAYISSIVIAIQSAGTTSTVTVQDKQGTPLKIVSGFSTASLLSNGNDIYNFQSPVKMVSGIDIVTAGAVAATIDIWINYYQ